MAIKIFYSHLMGGNYHQIALLPNLSDVSVNINWAWHHGQMCLESGHLLSARLGPDVSSKQVSSGGQLLWQVKGTLDVRYWAVAIIIPCLGISSLQLIPWHSSSVGVYEARLEPYHHTIIIIPTCQYMPKANVPYVTVTTHYWQFTHQRIATSPYTPYTYDITLNRITTFAHFLKCSAALSWQTVDYYILADLAITILYSVINDHDTLLQCCYKPS